MLSAFVPFVTDMYLPTLPSIAEVFDTTPSLVQMGLATSMIGLAVGQVFFSPLSDKYGRRHIFIAAIYAGAASAIFGAAGFMFGGIVSPLVGMGNIMSTTLVITAVCALCSFGFALISRRRHESTGI